MSAAGARAGGGARRTELVSYAGLRADGRRPHETRSIRTRLGFLRTADGSVLFELGQTRILAAVFGPCESARRSEQQHDRAHLHVDVSMSPFATPERRKHRVGDRRLAEIGLAVRRSLPQAVMSHLYPRSEVRLHLQILTSDGGELAACVTAATLAVMDAGVAMTDFVVGCAAALVDGRVLMDPTQAEAGAATAVIHLALLPRSRRVVLCQVASRIAADELRDAVDAASDGAVGVFGVVKAAVHDHAVKRLSKRGLLTA